MKNTKVNRQPASGFFAAVKAVMLVMIFTFTGASVNSAMAAEKTMTKEQTEARVMAIKDRVAEIKAMDMSHMSNAQRKEIRNELKEMKKELKSPTYIYISGAGLILIIILLILLL